MWLSCCVLLVEYVLLAWLVIHTGYRVFMIDEIDKFRDEWRSGEPREFKVLGVKNVISHNRENIKQISRVKDIETEQEIDIELDKWTVRDLVSVGKVVNIEFDKEDLYEDFIVPGYAKKTEILWALIGILLTSFILGVFVEIPEEKLDDYRYREKSERDLLKEARGKGRNIYFSIPAIIWVACSVISFGIAIFVACN